MVYYLSRYAAGHNEIAKILVIILVLLIAIVVFMLKTFLLYGMHKSDKSILDKYMV